jgi:hypothetical protein
MSAPWSVRHHVHCVAGHAVIAWLQGFKTENLWIEDNEEWAAGIRIDAPEFPGNTPIRSEREKRLARALIRGLLAQPAALMRFAFGSAGDALDFKDEETVAQPVVWEAISLAGRIEAQGRAVLPAAWKEVAEAFANPDIWCAVACVAEVLLAKGALT